MQVVEKQDEQTSSTRMTADQAVALALKATEFYYWQHVGWPDSAIIENATRFGKRAYLELKHGAASASDIVKALDELMLV